MSGDAPTSAGAVKRRHDRTREPYYELADRVVVQQIVGMPADAPGFGPAFEELADAVTRQLLRFVHAAAALSREADILDGFKIEPLPLDEEEAASDR